MSDLTHEDKTRHAAVFGATGGIGAALVQALGARGWRVAAGSRSGMPVPGAASAFDFDLTDEASIAVAAEGLRAHPPALVVTATGALTLSGARAPEKSFRELDPAALAEAFAINAIGPALIAKHMMPLLPRDRRAVFAALGARVGSIGDNRLGGWHSYRASKAALAMLVRNAAIELGRTHPLAIAVALHPGTVDTALSLPFQARLPRGKLLTPSHSADSLLTVIDGLGAADSGGVFDWRGCRIPE